MKEHLMYQTYDGNEKYIFLGFDKADRQPASKIVNNLIDRQFRICYDEHDNKDIADSDWIADRILSSELTIFLISADTLKSLEFRNRINYALSKSKNIFCVYLDDEEIDERIVMQLVNVPNTRLSSFDNANALCEHIIKTDFLNQDMRGQDVKITIKSNRKKKAALALIVSIFVLFIVAGAVTTVFRINYENSFAGQIEKMTEIGYLDISNEDATSIELLKDKKITTLVACNMGLTDIEALGYVNCEELDISGNPKVNTLEPLLSNEDLKIVKVTQDMYPAIAWLRERQQFKIIITG